MSGGRVIDRDLGWNRIVRDLSTSGDLVTAVGIFEAHNPRTGDAKAGATNAQVYADNEFGRPEKRIPERPTLRPTMDENQGLYVDLMRRLMGMVAEGGLSIKDAYALLGERVLADLRRKIQSGVPPPNSPMTIRLKGSSKTLIDTSQMLHATDYEVRSASEVKSQ